MSVLTTYIVNGLNDLDTYTSFTVHEQDSMVVSARGQTTCALLLMCYTASNSICAYIACVQLAGISKISHSRKCVQLSALN